MECGSANSNVWAVGDAGVIVHYNNVEWTEVSSPTSMNLQAVCGASANAIWAVGEAGTVLFYNGSMWTEVEVPGQSTLRGVWGTSASDVWVVGSQVILHWNGSTWTTHETTRNLSAVWSASTTDVWAVGSQGSQRWNGSTWSNVNSVRGYAVFGSSATDVWVVNSQIETRHFDGLAWTSHNLEPGSAWHNGLSAITRDAQGVLAVGGHGVMYRLMTAGWQRLTKGRLALIPDRVYMSSLSAAEGVTIAGGYTSAGAFSDQLGYTMTRSGQTWSGGGPSSAVRVVDVSASSATNIWAVNGWRSDIYRSDGTFWYREDTQNNADLDAIVALSSTDVWAVGDDQTHHWNGDSWSAIPNPISTTNVDLTVVDASSANNVWAGGSDGTILHWTGSSWMATSSNTSGDIRSLSTSSSSFAVATTGSQVLFWNGSSWSADDTMGVWEVWSPAPGQVWALRNDGISFWDGAWSSVPAPQGVMKIDGTGNELWALRSNGAVLHYE